MLALARAFGERDLATLDEGGNATFFTLFGVVFRYPAWLIWPLAGLAVLEVLVLALVTRRRTLVTIRRFLAGWRRRSSRSSRRRWRQLGCGRFSFSSAPTTLRCVIRTSQSCTAWRSRGSP